MSILIVTIPNDYHAMAVEWGLSQLGVETHVWMPGDLPDGGAVSLHFDPATGRFDVVTRFADVRTSHADVRLMWNRRRDTPRAPPFASAHDAKPIESESRDHYLNALFTLADTIRTINCPAAQARAEKKALQLRVAFEVGFAVLPTLLSNDHQAMCDFHAAHAPIIGKPYRQHLWVTDQGGFSALTFDMPDPREWDRRTIESCPIILQKKVVRHAEVRVVVFGETLIAMRLIGDSPDLPLDGRLALMHDDFANCRAIDPPVAVAAGCHQYLRRMGIEFGAFDFIVDRDERWHFLECNEAGQFLYLESAVPETRLLDRFCRWLCEAGGEAIADDVPPVTLAAFEASPEKPLLVARQSLHKKRERPNPVVYETDTPPRYRVKPSG